MTNPLSVMVVDADPALADAMRAGLSSEGFRCQAAASVEAAISVIHAAPVDVIISDLIHTGPGALDLAREAKRIKPDAAVVIVVDDLESFAYDTAVEHGVSDFILRPFSVRELSLRIRHVVHQETMRSVSVIDELTGLYNRRGFLTLASQQLKLSRREGRGIYMLYADVDGLKRINDTWGHGAGDITLTETAHLLRDIYRESDIVARIGGDEFVVVPIGSTGDNIGIIVNRLTDSLRARCAGGDLKYLRSLSVGVSFFDPAKPCSLEQFLHEAARRMYEHKRAESRES